MCRYCVHNFTVPVLTPISSFWETNLFFFSSIPCVSVYVDFVNVQQDWSLLSIDTHTLAKCPNISALVLIGVRLRVHRSFCPASGSTHNQPDNQPAEKRILRTHKISQFATNLQLQSLVFCANTICTRCTCDALLSLFCCLLNFVGCESRYNRFSAGKRPG